MRTAPRRATVLTPPTIPFHPRTPNDPPHPVGAPCCGARRISLVLTHHRLSPTAATRSPPSSRHRRRSGRSPLAVRQFWTQNGITLDNPCYISCRNLQNRCAILKRALNKRPYGCGGERGGNLPPAHPIPTPHPVGRGHDPADQPIPSLHPVGTPTGRPPVPSAPLQRT